MSFARYSKELDGATRIRFADTAKITDVFREIDLIFAHAHTVDTRPSFPSPQQPGYEAPELT